MPEARSTLERPAAKLISHFHIGQVGRDTVRLYLENGYSLAICCRDCPRLVEWTPSELQRRFGERLDLRISDLVPRLACTGDDGCGSRSIAVFPHLYDGQWSWPPADREPD